MSPTNFPMYVEFPNLADRGSAYLPTPNFLIYSKLLQFPISLIQLFISTLMQIRSECAVPTCSTICQILLSFRTLSDPEKACLPNPIPTLLPIRSKCASLNCSTICQPMPSFKTLADPGKAYLPTPICPNYSEQLQRSISAI